MTRRQILTIVLIAFVIGAAGSVVFNRVIFPYVSSIRGFSWVGKLQSSSPIVISRREEVRLNEGVNLIELNKQAQTVVVSIHSPANQRFLGNGVIITSDGTIFTTKEVIGTNTQVSVVATDGAIYQGTVRALDPRSSLAVITIPGKDLPVAQFSDAKNMQTAQRIFVLGKTNQEFSRQFVSGFISKTLYNNTDERVFSSEAFEHTIETDAEVNAEYIGGPVVNLQGLIIGMITGANGQILPSEAIDGAVRTYLETGKIQRPYVGLKYNLISKSQAKLRGLPEGGAQVAEVEANSPAAKAGLIPGELIISVNGQGIDASSFEQMLVEHGANEMRLMVKRGAEEREALIKPEMR